MRFFLRFIALSCVPALLVGGGPAWGQPGPTALRGDTTNAGTFVPPTGPTGKAQSPLQAVFEPTFEGFTPEAEAAFRYALSIWETHLQSSVPIRVRAIFEPLDSSTLGSTSPNLVSFERRSDTDGLLDADLWYAAALAEAVVGRPLNGDRADFTTSFNNTVGSWYFGTDGATPRNRYDFVTTALHEIGHGLGFTSSFRVDRNGGSGCPEAPEGWGCWGFDFGLSNVDPPGYPFVFDRFMEDDREVPLLSPIDYANPSRELGDVLQSRRLRFDGPTTRRVNGEVPIDLYAPTNFEPGSSISHLDESAFPAGEPNSLMTPTLARAEAIHSPGPVLCALFQDLGWPLGVGCIALLPQAGVALELNAEDDDITLTLRTFATDNARSLEIQQRVGTGPFRTIYTMTSPNVPASGATLDYPVDDLAPGAYAFRVRQVDFGGAVSYSEPVAVTIDLTTPFFLSEAYPNPAGARARWDLLVDTAQEVVAEVFDVRGRPSGIVFEGEVVSGERRVFTLDAAALPAGLYLLRVRGETFDATRTVVHVQ